MLRGRGSRFGIAVLPTEGLGLAGTEEDLGDAVGEDGVEGVR